MSNQRPNTRSQGLQAKQEQYTTDVREKSKTKRDGQRDLVANNKKRRAEELPEKKKATAARQSVVRLQQQLSLANESEPARARREAQDRHQHHEARANETTIERARRLASDTKLPSTNRTITPMDK